MTTELEVLLTDAHNAPNLNHYMAPRKKRRGKRIPLARQRIVFAHVACITRSRTKKSTLSYGYTKPAAHTSESHNRGKCHKIQTDSRRASRITLGYECTSDTPRLQTQRSLDSTPEVHYPLQGMTPLYPTLMVSHVELQLAKPPIARP